MFGLSDSSMISGMIVWFLWVGLVLAAFLSFLRGMRALTQIATRLENIERILTTRPAIGPNSSTSHSAS